jgi:hypothetical protein
MPSDNPLKWLLGQLPAYIAPAELAELMERYTANKRAYDRETKIRHAKRIIANYERFSQSPANAAVITKWRATLARRESERDS